MYLLARILIVNFLATELVLAAVPDMNLVNPDTIRDSVLSDSFHIVNIDENEKGEITYRRWTPSKDTDRDTLNEQQDFKGTSIRATSGIQYVEAETIHSSNSIRTDYIDLNRTISQIHTMATGPVDAVVETVIVCDKEFGDLFNHDQKKIMDYWTVYFWDVNTRYKSLPSNNLSFRVNAIVVISNVNGQPFIEQSRASDGRAEFGRILEKYSLWVYSQRNSLPKGDMYPLVTNTKLEWGGGLAYMRGPCWVDTGAGRNLGTLVWNDGGDWSSLTVGAHEIGHNVGAPHDDDKDFPGGCTERGFIMSGGNDEKRYFFSSCSDRTISDFVRSDAAACLLRIDGTKTPQLDPSFSKPKAPTAEQFCKISLKSQKAYIEKKDTYNCKTLRCLKPDETQQGLIWIYQIAPVENTICGDGGNCFRGRCRPPAYIFRNVGSGLCMRARNPFEFMAPAEMFNCPKSGTPLERFALTSNKNGQFLNTPFTLNGNNENGEKCLFTGNAEGDAIWTDRCNGDNPWQGWEFKDTGNGQFLLVHKVTGRCSKPASRSLYSEIKSYKNCNSNDADMKWTRYL